MNLNSLPQNVSYCLVLVFSCQLSSSPFLRSFFEYIVDCFTEYYSLRSLPSWLHLPHFFHVFLPLSLATCWHPTSFWYTYYSQPLSTSSSVSLFVSIAPHINLITIFSTLSRRCIMSWYAMSGVRGLMIRLTKYFNADELLFQDQLLSS